uniref:Uronyl 2-sulfotransferase-like n=1 Tax=Ciona intestinalis TaxID=7719 RepID=F6RBI7_CIOIN|nr:uronyl 2-sulfotransferase-like [Ciona intestinalis]|eukprot:XP_002130122.1 uronyl 2-sulfotransferase-like [Ciona intestinalis]
MPRWSFRRQLILTLSCILIGGVMYLNSITSNRRARSNDGLRKNSLLDLQRIRKDIDNKDRNYVVYNRVPKCGSMSMTTLCYRLGGANGFKVASPYEDGEKPNKNEEEEANFVEFLHEQSPGYMYIRHQYFIDFTRFGQKQPLYVNMIRDPVSRFESFYYFSRFGNERGGGGASSRMSEIRRQESIDECIQRRRQECIKPYWQVVPYFCGQDPGCMSRSKWAVDKAKQNIKEHYVFVGILEDLDNSLKVLEAILPSYFNDASNIYLNPENERMKHETHTRNKRETSEAARDFLKSETSLKLEYDLYEFVKSELENLKTLVL